MASTRYGSMPVHLPFENADGAELASPGATCVFARLWV
jgi:hypothetical protein